MSVLKDPKVLDPLGLFEAYENKPVPPSPPEEEPEYMPLPDDERARIVKRRSLMNQSRRRGRQSTVNTAMTDKLG